jgi:inorganic pyrophosphatase
MPASPTARDPLWSLMSLLHKSHPWHGIELGDKAPQVVTTWIEIVPTDTIKFEIDKHTGHLMIDRPQRYSNVLPCLYGFLPQTLCAAEVASYAMAESGLDELEGDGDPLDICVFTECAVGRGDLQARAIPIGGLRMIDGGEADDKIIAVLEGDASYGHWRDISDMPAAMIERLKHYFVTYKRGPGATADPCRIEAVYDAARAHECIRRSQADYRALFPDIEALLSAALRG